MDKDMNPSVDTKTPAKRLTDMRREAMYGGPRGGLNTRQWAHLQWLLTHFSGSQPDERGNRTFVFHGELVGRTLEEAIDARLLAEVNRHGDEFRNLLREEMPRVEGDRIVLSDDEERVLYFLKRGYKATKDVLNNVLISGKRVCDRDLIRKLELKGLARACESRGGVAVAWEVTQQGRQWQKA